MAVRSIPVLIALAGLFHGAPSLAVEPGWHFSPLPGEGDRATLGCDRQASAERYTCIAVRCEDDFAVGAYIHTSRPDAPGRWTATVDRENASLGAQATSTPYSARLTGDTAWLLDRLAQGAFIYLRHEHDHDGDFAYIDLTGSLAAINQALYYCAPRTPPSPQ